MSSNKALKIGLGLLAGGLVGFAVYKGVEVGFREEEQNQQAQQGTTPGIDPAVYNAVKAAQPVANQPESKPKEESKGSIIQRGIKSAATTCTLVTGAAQCVSGIADNISRMAGMFENPSLYSNQSQYYQYPYQQSYLGQQPYNPIYMSNGQVWNRINPLVVSTGFGGGVGVSNPGGYAI